MWRTEQNRTRTRTSDGGSPSLELDHFVIRRLYAQTVGSLSAWHPRRACLIQSTMLMRVCQIRNHLNLPAPDGPVSSITTTRQRLSAKSLACLQVFPPQFLNYSNKKPMSSDGRSRRRELVEEAYQLQVKAGLMARHIPLTEPTR